MDFDLLSEKWDTERRIERAAIISNEIKAHMEIQKEYTALDFGCGTGLISFNLHNDFERIDLLDSSEGMINKLSEKINKTRIANMNPIHFDSAKKPGFGKKYNVIYSSMVLHHISDINTLIKNFYSHLANDGKLCIVDLNRVSELFHRGEPDFAGHHGFDIPELSGILIRNNFTKVTTKTFYHSDKEIDNGIVPYSLFIMTAVKG